MLVKEIIDEDFTNYKKTSMFIGFPTCTFKCEKECGINCCQNSELAKAPDIETQPMYIVERYLKNPITKAVVIGGLEPFDSFCDLLTLVYCFRIKKINDNIIIYTGYEEAEVKREVGLLTTYKNIIIKFGRFVPNQQKHYDKILGVYLASDNQYAKRIS